MLYPFDMTFLDEKVSIQQINSPLRLSSDMNRIFRCQSMYNKGFDQM